MNGNEEMTTKECRKCFLEATGRVISKKRKQKNITQKELGKVINVDGSTIGRYEKGTIEIPTSALPLISGACDFSMWDYLVEWEGIDVASLVRKALSSKSSLLEESEIQYILDNCTPEELDKIKDIGLCVNHSYDFQYQDELLTFMIEYHIKNKKDDLVKKRMMTYYEKITGTTLSE